LRAERCLPASDRGPVECFAFARLRIEAQWGWVDAVGVIEMSPGIGITRGWGGLGVGVGDVVDGEEEIGCVELVTRR
jgi:hypothetical protein